MALQSLQPTIPDFVLNRLPEIEALCREFHVIRLELVGSATGTRFEPQRSDLDFLVAWNWDPCVNPLPIYFGLRDALANMFGRNVDFLSYRSLDNPFMRESINEQRVLLYSAADGEAAQ